ncbi:MAG: hypothetical protein AAB570_01305 [Patescibacteria group bacterium]
MSFFTLTFWFDRVPHLEPATLKLYFILFLAAVIVGATVRWVTRRKAADKFGKEIGRRVAVMLVVMGVLGLLYWFAGWQRVPFLSSRFWLILWDAGLLYWLVVTVRYAVKIVPQERERLHQVKANRQYFKKT